jgi:hypothetical protein
VTSGVPPYRHSISWIRECRHRLRRRLDERAEPQRALANGQLLLVVGPTSAVLANRLPLRLIQVQTSGGIYSERSLIFSLLMSIDGHSRRRRVVGREKRAPRLFVVDPLELVIAPDRAGASRCRPGVNHLEEPLQMREGSQRIGFALPHA